jgi:hypothetical protein
MIKEKTPYPLTVRFQTIASHEAQSHGSCDTQSVMWREEFESLAQVVKLMPSIRRLDLQTIPSHEFVDFSLRGPRRRADFHASVANGNYDYALSGF